MSLIIYKPPIAVEGKAVNLSKGQKVFDVVVTSSDEIRTVSSTEIVNQLKAVHNPGYVDDVLNFRTTNGYMNWDEDCNDHSLTSCAIIKYAAIDALSEGVLFAPVSGFHHAGHDFGGGYCTFNGLVLAADTVKAYRPEAEILIIDGDGHFGDGTEDLARKGRIDWLRNLSLCRERVEYDAQVALDKVMEALSSRTWDLVIYQAGADSHIKDPYDVGYLDDEQWVARDELIFSTCKRLSIPLVFCLAGGYNGELTIGLHRSTVETCRRVFGK